METEKKVGIERHLDKVGVFGVVFAALCCLGVPAVFSIAAALGLGYFINDAIMMPLLVVSLVVALFGLWLERKHHGRDLAFGVGLAGALTTLVFVVVIPNTALASVGIAVLVAASFINVWLRMRRRPKERDHPIAQMIH
jgi:mercuric ion transport protein